MDTEPHGLLVRALEAAANAVLIARREGTIVWVNDALCRQSGYRRGELVGRTPRVLKSGRHSREFYRALWDTILAGRAWRGELIERRRNGSLYHVDEIISPLLDAKGRVSHFIAIQQDVSAAAKERSRIRRLAYHDSLTGLPNRALFLKTLSQSIAQAASRGERAALLFLDLDGFKAINDKLGHAVGDRLLQAVADRLRGAVRRSDPVARLGGDEFTVLLADIDSAERPRILMRKLTALMRQPFSLRGCKVRVGASVGIALYPEHARSAKGLLAYADAAMYRAKKQRRVFDLRQKPP